MTNKSQLVDRISEILWSVDRGNISKTDGRTLINEAYTEYTPEKKAPPTQD